MQLRISIGLAVIATAWLMPRNLFAQASKYPTEVITAELSSNDDAKIRTGLADAQRMLATHKPDSHFLASVDDWMHALYTDKRFDELDQLVASGICGRATDLPTVEKYQLFRVRIKLAQGKPD